MFLQNCLGTWEDEEGKGCQNDDAYTYKGGGCDGWSGIKMEECRQHCMSNNLPQKCSPTQLTCKYAIYSKGGSGWCHLANKCGMKNKGNHVLMKLTRGNLNVCHKISSDRLHPCKKIMMESIFLNLKNAKQTEEIQVT